MVGTPNLRSRTVLAAKANRESSPPDAILISGAGFMPALAEKGRWLHLGHFSAVIQFGEADGQRGMGHRKIMEMRQDVRTEPFSRRCSLFVSSSAFS